MVRRSVLGDRFSGRLERCDGGWTGALGGARQGADRPPASQTASIRHRHRQPGRGITSVMGTSDRDDRTGAEKLLR